VLNWVDPYSWGDREVFDDGAWQLLASDELTAAVTYQLSRLVVGVQVLFAGISLPEKYLWHRALSLCAMLGGIMTTAWFATALFIWGTISSLTFLEALCIASAVTPTDPVLANSITTGHYAEKHVPENVRNLIVAESGANDGLGYPFFYLALFLMVRTKADYGTAIGHEIWRWFYGVVLYEILLSVVYGAVMGYVARKVLRWASDRHLIDMCNFFSYGFGLAIFTLGTAGLFGTDDVLACFVAGNSFTWDDWFRLRLEENDFQEIIDMLFNTAIFMYIGAIIPWSEYSNSAIGLSGWRVVVLGILIILGRRMPWVVAAYKLVPALRSWKEALFTGWFGPIGVSAVYYIEVAIRKVPDDNSRTHVRQVIAPVVLYCVFSSVVMHGITIPFTYYGPLFVRHTTTISQLPLSKTRAVEEDMGHLTFSERLIRALRFWERIAAWRHHRSAAAQVSDIGAPIDPRRKPEIPPHRHEGVDEEVCEHCHSQAALDDVRHHRPHPPHLHRSPQLSPAQMGTDDIEALPGKSDPSSASPQSGEAQDTPDVPDTTTGSQTNSRAPSVRIQMPAPAVTVSSFAHAS